MTGAGVTTTGAGATATGAGAAGATSTGADGSGAVWPAEIAAVPARITETPRDKRLNFKVFMGQLSKFDCFAVRACERGHPVQEFRARIVRQLKKFRCTRNGKRFG